VDVEIFLDTAMVNAMILYNEVARKKAADNRIPREGIIQFTEQWLCTSCQQQQSRHCPLSETNRREVTEGNTDIV